jgi:hypothetical protein
MKGIDPKNLAAQLDYIGVGNPPTTHPKSAISNCFPGLETDLRNVWKRILVGIELHEASNLVVKADENVEDEVRLLPNNYRLISIDGEAVTVIVRGPKFKGGPVVELPDLVTKDPNMPLEWSNALASVVHNKAGLNVRCVFQPLEKDDPIITVMLRVRNFFEEEAGSDGTVKRRAVIARELAEPGEMTQSLCSPWQNDYRECACFYWAASRPDYVNVEPRTDGTSTGHNWMARERDDDTPEVYVVDDRQDASLVTYDELFEDWEKAVKFIIGGKDAE